MTDRSCSFTSQSLRCSRSPWSGSSSEGGPILSAEDSKSIFGNIPEILAVHQKIVVGREGGEGEREGRKKEGGREGREGLFCMFGTHMHMYM